MSEAEAKMDEAVWDNGLGVRHLCRHTDETVVYRDSEMAGTS